MTPEDWSAAKEILGEALELPGAERSPYLDRACGGDARIRHLVEELIESDQRTWKLMEAPAAAAASFPAEVLPISSGARIGAYEIVKEIGHGGMGIVYLARRADEQFEKGVAIKLTRFGMAGDEMDRRFRAERQIVAGLDHPNIARLLDGGATPDGQPYLVMEYVEGAPLLEWCSARDLSTRQRLEIFLEVCAAVQYAHQHLIVHRDLKPGNILVTEEGTVKLLDFGIAKLIAPELAGNSADKTGTLFRLLTPDYASPEQVRGEPISTASDVYALGVVLYELLSGQRPYRVADSSAADLVRIVCETEPQRPSAAVAHGAGDLSEDRRKKSKELSGDLDAIVLKAMRKEPGRRYVSAGELALDIRRYLQHLPVEARRGNLRYRAAKFLARHKAAMAAAAVILAALVAGLLWNLREARRARAAEARAERRFAEVRKVANSYLFELHDAISSLPGSTPARALLVRRALEYLDGLAREKGTDAALRRELAEAYQKVGDVQAGISEAGNLGQTAEALRSYRKALAIREALVAEAPQDAVRRGELATTLSATGRLMARMGNPSGSLANFRKALRLREELLSANPTDAKLLKAAAKSYFDLGDYSAERGDYAAALEFHRKDMAIFEDLMRQDPVGGRRNAALAEKKVGALLEKLGDLPAAAELYRKALRLDQERSESNPLDALARLDLSYSYGSLGNCVGTSGDIAGALENYARALAIRRDLSAADPKNQRFQDAVASAHLKVGFYRLEAGDAAGARESYREAAAIHQATSRADPSNKNARENLAIVLAAEADAEQALAAAPGTAVTARPDHWKQARAHYRESLDIWLDLRERGAMSAGNADELDRISQQLTLCDRALERR